MGWKYGSFDIETVGRSPLDSSLSCVVSIGARKIMEDGSVDSEVWIAGGKVNNPETGKTEPRWENQVKAVRKLLEFFENPSDGSAKLYSFNGISFDFSYLRSKFSTEDYGDLTRKINELEQHHVDLRKKAIEKNFYKGLENLASEMDIEHDVDCSGSEVQSVWENNNFELLEDYTEEDVRVTLEIACGFNNHFD